MHCDCTPARCAFPIDSTSNHTTILMTHGWRMWYRLRGMNSCLLRNTLGNPLRTLSFCELYNQQIILNRKRKSVNPPEALICMKRMTSTNPRSAVGLPAEFFHSMNLHQQHTIGFAIFLKIMSKTLSTGLGKVAAPLAATLLLVGGGSGGFTGGSAQSARVVAPLTSPGGGG